MSAPSVLFICLLTFNRLEYATRTLHSALWYVRTEKNRLRVHIASDGDDEIYTTTLRDLAGGFDHVEAITFSNSRRQGYGANVNAAVRVMHKNDARYVLMLEDDWELKHTLDLDPLCCTLDTSPYISCIRLGYLGFTQPLRGEVECWCDQHYLVLDQDSPEPHVFAGHPRLETVEYQKRVGDWPENMLPGDTEFRVASYPNARRGVAWPMALHPRGDLFAHIGSVRSY